MSTTKKEYLTVLKALNITYDQLIEDQGYSNATHELLRLIGEFTVRSNKGDK